MQQNGNFIHKLNHVGNRSCNFFLKSLFFTPQSRRLNLIVGAFLILLSTPAYALMKLVLTLIFLVMPKKLPSEHSSTLLTNVVEITTATFKVSSIVIENLLLCYLSYEYFTKLSSIKCSYNFIRAATISFEVSCKDFESLLLAVLYSTFKDFNVYNSCRRLSIKLVNWFLRSVVHRPYQVLTYF